MSILINPSSILSGGKRQLNVAIAQSYQVYETDNFVQFGGRRLRSFALNKSFSTISVVRDFNTVTAFDGASALLDGKVYDISKSGERDAFCLNVHLTSGSVVPVRYAKFADLSLPINANGDVILGITAVPSPLEVVEEDAVYWMGLPMRCGTVSL
jgi:hypothetical protein